MQSLEVCVPLYIYNSFLVARTSNEKSDIISVSTNDLLIQHFNCRSHSFVYHGFILLLRF